MSEKRTSELDFDTAKLKCPSLTKYTSAGMMQHSTLQ